jgi:SAM-dependent methyltransferase
VTEAAISPSEYREIWDKKPVLRAVYRDYYRRIDAQRRRGLTLELGAGSGNLKEELPEVIATDITPSKWLDAAVDAQAMPFADGSVTNIVGVDILHHFERPRRFFTEAQRVLAAGGRIVLVEPAITPISWLFFKAFHPEPIDMRADPLDEGAPTPGRDPFESNQAIPTLLAGRRRGELERAFPGLRVVARTRLSLFAYPLSGGFRRWSLVPAWLVRPLLALERLLQPVLAPIMGFRLFLVVERGPT